MKNTTPLFFLCFAVGILSALPAFTQQRFSLSLKTQTGVAGLLPDHVYRKENNTGTRTTVYEPKVNVSLGLAGALYFGKKQKVGIGVEMLANRVAFGTVMTQTYRPPIKIENREIREFEFYNVLAPLYMNFRHKKLTFSLGVINSWHLYGKVSPVYEGRNVGSDPPTPWRGLEGRGAKVWFNDSEEDNPLEHATFTRLFRMQPAAGISWQLTESLVIGAEYAHAFSQNMIVDKLGFISDEGETIFFVSEHPFRYNSLNLALQWQLFPD